MEVPPVQVLTPHQFLHHLVDGRRDPVALGRVLHVQRIQRRGPLGGREGGGAAALKAPGALAPFGSQRTG